MREPHRGVAPVIGVMMMVLMTLVLASVFAAGALSLAETQNTRQWATETMAGNPLSGSPGDLVRISDTTAGATDVTYRMNFSIEPGSDTIGNSLNSIYMEVTTGSPDTFSSTAQSDLVRVVIDKGSDGTIDREITSDVTGWQVQNGGSALKIEFSGSAYTPEANDSVIATFEGATNPDTAGTYDLRAQTSGDGNWHYGTITITEQSDSGSIVDDRSLTASHYGQNRYRLTHALPRSSSQIQGQFGAPVGTTVKRPSFGARRVRS